MKVFYTYICFLLYFTCLSNANPSNTPILINSNYVSFKDSIIYNVTGVIVSKNKTILKLKMDSTSSLPKINQTALLSKSFDNTIGKMHVTGWLDIANIKIIAIKENFLNVLIDKELSITYINGEKKNHFKAGTQIKIRWKEPE